MEASILIMWMLYPMRLKRWKQEYWRWYHVKKLKYQNIDDKLGNKKRNSGSFDQYFDEDKLTQEVNQFIRQTDLITSQIEIETSTQLQLESPKSSKRVVKEQTNSGKSEKEKSNSGSGKREKESKNSGGRGNESKKNSANRERF